MRKEARYGKSKSYRKRIKGPDGKYHDVYGRTIAERDLAVAELRASWAAEEKLAADPFVWQYAAHGSPPEAGPVRADVRALFAAD